MSSIEEQVVSHLVDWDEQRAGIERFAEMVVAYRQVLVDGGVDDDLMKLLVLQYQAGLLSLLNQGKGK